MLARIALCAGLLLPIAGNADPKSANLVAENAVFVELHGLDVSWNGAPLGGYSSLRTKCKELHRKTKGAEFTLVSGIDTPQSEVRRIVKILKEACGAQYVAYDILVHLNR